MIVKDLTNQDFGDLHILFRDGTYTGPNNKKTAKWLAQCKCGKYMYVRTYDLTKENGTQSCKECSLSLGKEHPNFKHGLTNHELFRKLQGMKDRCNNRKIRSWLFYGAKGIKVCEEWSLPDGQGFINFYNWSLENGWEPGLTIDRIDFRGDYSPDNCRYITIKEQQRNKSNNHYIDYDEKRLSLVQLIEDYSVVNEATFLNRIYAEWSMEDALTIPANETKHRLITYNNVTLPIGRMWSRFGGACNYQTFHRRIQEGWNIERALLEPPMDANTFKLATYNGDTDTYKNLWKKYCTADITYEAFCMRLREGWSIEDALLKPKNNPVKSIEIEYEGKTYPSYKALCRSVNLVDYATFHYRTKKGWDIKDALTIPTHSDKGVN